MYFLEDCHPPRSTWCDDCAVVDAGHTACFKLACDSTVIGTGLIMGGLLVNDRHWRECEHVFAH